MSKHVFILRMLSSCTVNYLARLVEGAWQAESALAEEQTAEWEARGCPDRFAVEQSSVDPVR